MTLELCNTSNAISICFMIWCTNTANKDQRHSKLDGNCMGGVPGDSNSVIEVHLLAHHMS